MVQNIDIMFVFNEWIAALSERFGIEFPIKDGLVSLLGFFCLFLPLALRLDQGQLLPKLSFFILGSFGHLVA